MADVDLDPVGPFSKEGYNDSKTDGQSLREYDAGAATVGRLKSREADIEYKQKTLPDEAAFAFRGGVPTKMFRR